MSASTTALLRLQASRRRLAARLQAPRAAGSAGFALASQTGDALLRPLAQQHPLGLTAAAFAGGAALVSFKPWRAITSSTLLSRLATQCVEQWAAQLPLSAVLATVQDAALSYIATSAELMRAADGDA